ncbi:putative biofilm-associated protein [Macrococcoides caseolyticum]|uniref:Ig-like domain-containing protein n=1 Tax=Macrococcoides caseolyticum TaxID=69966 RepID=UPI001167AAD1|nr:Ig-like domain-containing protein [Macrococcus caseolyticus]VUC66796.1 putative biofilm-associated protein [Macrococcus caseolyticus]
MKKFLACLISVLLVSLNLTVNFAQAAADVEKPVIKSVSVDKKSANAGDIVTYTVVVTDNVKVESVYINLTKPQTGNQDLKSMTSIGNNMFQYKMEINKESESGAWKVSSVIAYDTASNKETHYNTQLHGYGTRDYSAATVEITGGSADVEKPVIKSVSVDKKSANAGDIVTYTVVVTDNVKVESVYINLTKPQTGNQDLKSMTSIGNNMFQYKMEINKESESGAWKVSSVIAYDTVSNKETHYNTQLHGHGTRDYSAATVEITGGSADVEKPVIKSVAVDKKSAKAGDIVTYTVVVTDNVKVESVYINLTKPQTGNQDLKSMTSIGNNMYQYKMLINNESEIGAWKVSSVIAYDTASNKETHYNTQLHGYGTKDYSSANVNVGNNIAVEVPTTERPTTEKPTTETPTTEKPTTETPLDTHNLLKSISVSKQSLKQGDNVKFTAKVLDDSRAKISKVMLSYVDYEQQDVMYFDLYPTARDTFVLEQEVDETFKPGKWKVTNIAVEYNGGEIQNFFNTKAEFGTKYKPYADYSNIDLTIAKSDKPVFIPKGVLYSDSDYERKLHNIKIRYGNNEIYTDRYIAYQTTDQAIRGAMSNLDSSVYYYDSVNVSKGYTMLSTGQMSYSGTSSDITINVKAYADYNKPVVVDRPTTEKPTTEKPTTEKPTTERPTTEKPTTEKPTTEKPTTERPTTEKPTTEKPTTEKPTTEKPTTEKPVSSVKPKPVKNSKPVVNPIDDNDIKITGKAKSGSTVYVLVKNKVIGKGNAKNGKYSISVKKQKAGTTVSIYSVYKKVKSSKVTTKVLDKTPPSFTKLNKVTTKSRAVTGKGENSAFVTVIKNRKVIANGKVNSKGTFNLKIKGQKKGTVLTVYLKDKAGNSSKKSIKVTVK